MRTHRNAIHSLLLSKKPQWSDKADIGCNNKLREHEKPQYFDEATTDCNNRNEETYENNREKSRSQKNTIIITTSFVNIIISMPP